MRHRKLLIKSILYRPYSEIITFLIAWCVTGHIGISLTIGIADLILKVFSYFFFDFMWNKFVKTNYRSSVVWLTGLSGSGKTTIARELQTRLRENGTATMLLDGDEVREIFKQTGFDKKSRDENVKNVGRIAAFLQRRGTVAVVSMISPYKEVREECRRMATDFMEVYVSTPLDVCETRDVKGLYKRARAGEIRSFTGIHDDAPYEQPQNADITINTDGKTVTECVDMILFNMKQKHTQPKAP